MSRIRSGCDRLCLPPCQLQRSSNLSGNKKLMYAQVDRAGRKSHQGFCQLVALELCLRGQCALGRVASVVMNRLESLVTCKPLPFSLFEVSLSSANTKSPGNSRNQVVVTCTYGAYTLKYAFLKKTYFIWKAKWPGERMGRRESSVCLFIAQVTTRCQRADQVETVSPQAPFRSPMWVAGPLVLGLSSSEMELWAAQSVALICSS